MFALFSKRNANVFSVFKYLGSSSAYAEGCSRVVRALVCAVVVTEVQTQIKHVGSALNVNVFDGPQTVTRRS